MAHRLSSSIFGDYTGSQNSTTSNRKAKHCRWQTDLALHHSASCCGNSMAEAPEPDRTAMLCLAHEFIARSIAKAGRCHRDPGRAGTRGQAGFRCGIRPLVQICSCRGLEESGRNGDQSWRRCRADLVAPSSRWEGKAQWCQDAVSFRKMLRRCRAILSCFLMLRHEMWLLSGAGPALAVEDTGCTMAAIGTEQAVNWQFLHWHLFLCDGIG